MLFNIVIEISVYNYETKCRIFDQRFAEPLAGFANRGCSEVPILRNTVLSLLVRSCWLSVQPQPRGSRPNGLSKAFTISECRLIHQEVEEKPVVTTENHLYR